MWRSRRYVASFVRGWVDTLCMHQIAGWEQDEDGYGRPRIVWVCGCGRRGSGASPKAATSGFKRHVRGRYRVGEY